MTKPTTSKEQSPRRRQSYTPAQKAEAVLACKRGKSVDEVSDITKIPARCIRRWVKIAKDTSANYSEAMTISRRGPPPQLCFDAENSIYEWIIGRQMQGSPVGRQEIIQRAGEISLLVCGAVVGEGWYRRFKDRFPAIGARRSQNVTKARNTVSTEDITSFFWSLTKVMIENEIGHDASRIFNVDETAFKCGKTSTQVVALRGSRNVWHTDPSMGFHLSFVACGSAGGYAVPPLFILPVERVDNYILEECSIPGAAVTTTDKAFMTARLFARWLVFFSEAVNDNIKRPIVLIMDGCSSHFSEDIKQTAKRLQIVLVCLPANATHLLQPLDVACFSSFKVKLKVLIDQLVSGKGESSISKPMAIQIASLAWMSCNFSNNISSGFKTCGIFPLSLVKMHSKLQNFRRNGLPVHVHIASWLRVKEVVQSDLLMLPPPRKQVKRKRKTTTTQGRILTQELLNVDATAEVPMRCSQPTKRKQHKQPSKHSLRPNQASTDPGPVLYEMAL